MYEELSFTKKLIKYFDLDSINTYFYQSPFTDIIYCERLSDRRLIFTCNRSTGIITMEDNDKTTIKIEDILNGEDNAMAVRIADRILKR